ncbi:MAG: 50S ribosomal protein L11 [Candidatus Micrarchaeia archaeon]
MAETIISSLIEGGKASGGPPLGLSLGPLGVNLNAIVAEINSKTKDFEGIRVPVKIIVDTSTKAYKVEVGLPPTSALILKELGLQHGAKTKDEIVGNLTKEQIEKIAKTKSEQIYGKDLNAKMKQVAGTCKSLGVTCEGESPKAFIQKLSKKPQE